MAGLDGWSRGKGHLFRYIENKGHRRGRLSNDRVIATPLRESLLRFVSSPIRGVERRHEYHDSPGRPLSMHTFRVLTSRKPPERIRRIYFFHNGLNELDRTGLYYQLASEIIASAEAQTSGNEGVACILRPFPGHLTRARYARFAEEPLQRYLWDGSHLFNQFLRYMTETQWFLSAIVTRSSYRCPSGAELLKERSTPKESRLNSPSLAGAIEEDWRSLSQASREAADLVEKRRGSPDGGDRPPEELAPSPVIERSIETLRKVLALEKWPQIGGRLRPVREREDEEPSLHVVGYSLGGFTAQSVFMSWPFVISSCSTLLSGGALRELSPTAFAHHEEWQTVLHSLRYEIDEGMLDGRYVVGDAKVAGLTREHFHHLQRTFYEVFQQEFRGSYESRLKAFRQRMLFILGGDDPIVRPDSVLDSAPPGGMNAVEIAGLGHFLARDPRGGEERGQREFWLPEVGKLIGRFSADAAMRHIDMRDKIWLNSKLEVPIRMPTRDAVTDGDKHEVQRLTDRRRLEIPGDGALSNRLFGLCLNDLLARQKPIRVDRTKSTESNPESGLLLVLRNEVPTLLLHPRAVLRRARALYHDDDHIAKYCRDIHARAEAFRDGMPQATLVVPWNARRLMKTLDPPHRFPSQAESAVGHIAREMDAATTWADCDRMLARLADEVEGSVLVFDGRRELGCEAATNAVGAELIEQHSSSGEALHVPSMPDCWLWMHAKFLALDGWGAHRVDGVRDLFLSWIARLTGDIKHERERAQQELADHLQLGQIRAVTVSRARYNPRFRGKLIFEPHAVRQLCVHAALCLSVAGDYRTTDMTDGDIVA
jgi:hypothetical protein